MSRNSFDKKEEKWILDNYEKQKKITKLAEMFNKEFNKGNSFKKVDSTRKKIAYLLKAKNLTKTTRLEDTPEFKGAKSRSLSKSKYYFVTWQQNATPIHKKFYKNMLAYKEYLGAELSVILGRYRNPTSVFPDRAYETWDPTTKEYWDASRHDIHKYLSVLSDVKIVPTKKYPLREIQGLAQGKSIILGHPKLHLKSEPTLNGYPKKVMFTTGAVTVPNYTDSGRGAISKGVHKFGFVIVEIKNDEVFFVRQVEADKNGDFIDLCHEVKKEKVTTITKAIGLVCGDSHQGVLDERIDKKNDEICEYFNIKNLVLHDVSDGESCNNHIIKSPIEQYKRFQEGKNMILQELDQLGDWLAPKLKYGPIIPRANHNDRYDRILDQDWRKDVLNAPYYLEYTMKVLNNEADKGVLAYYLDRRFGSKVQCLDYQDSLMLGKYECSQHGDHGANGAKGSPTSFRNLEIPIIVAHTHTTYRADDCIYVGTNTEIPLNYSKKGPSSWNHSNAIVGKNKIAQIILFVNGEFTTFEPLN